LFKRTYYLELSFDFGRFASSLGLIRIKGGSLLMTGIGLMDRYNCFVRGTERELFRSKESKMIIGELKVDF
jgi:hypothetical protein